MIRRVSAALLVLLLLIPSTRAFPWKKVAKVAVVWIAPAASSILATKGGIDCRRRFGPEPCTAHYGEFRGTEISRGAVSLSMSATTWACLKETKAKDCYTFALGSSAFNLYWWRHEENIHSLLEKSH